MLTISQSDNKLPAKFNFGFVNSVALSIEQFSELARQKLLPALPNPRLVICEPTSNSPAFVECESYSAIARLTYWEQGTAFCEIWDTASDNEVFSHHFDVGSEAKLIVAFNAFQSEIVRTTDQVR